MDVSNARVCVVIVNYNSSEYLKKCLSALERQTLPPHRTIVVDNASQKPLSMDGRGNVELICLQTNVGFAKANNMGIGRGLDTDFIALLNPDAYPQPRWLEEMVRAALLHPEFSFFASCLRMANEPSLLDGAGDAYHTSGLVWRKGHGKPAGYFDTADREVFSPCAAAAMYRTKALVSCGGFDESYFCYSEDVDLGFRLLLMGHRCLYVANALVFHVGSAVTGRSSDFSVYHGHRNLVWTFVKNMPGPLLWFYLPQHLALNLFSLLWFGLKGRLSVIFKAKKDALLNMGMVLKKRKTIQRQKQISCAALRRLMAKGFDIRN